MSLSSGLVPDFLKNIFSDTSEEKCMYVFRSNQILERLKVNCSGNVNSSPFREAIALRMGIEIVKKMEPEEKTIVCRINNDKDHALERKISDYIKTGKWAWQAVNTEDDAKGFYRYAAEHLHPQLQHTQKHGKFHRESLYAQWLEDLKAFKKISCSNLGSIDFSSAAVGVFYHTALPEDFN